jgi:hypothetical protein
MNRAEQLSTMTPQLIADVTLYPPSEGGRKSIAFPGWGCPCVASKSQPIVGYDGWLLLGDTPFKPSSSRRVGFVFLSGEEAAEIMRKAGTFYLWEGRFVGEAVVVRDSNI